VIEAVGLTNCIYNYNNYILNLVGGYISKFSRNRLVSGALKLVYLGEH
jgi:hypothetical protein